jgi:hypothetical protein
MKELCIFTHKYFLLNKIITYTCVLLHKTMSDYERKRIELDLKTFTSRNFEKPSECRNLDQIRFYVRELCLKIEELESKFHYVPQWAYSLLAQYNSRQNSMISVDFRNTYC